MKRVLVTGATGFVGSRIATHLHEAGIWVISTARSPRPALPLPDYRPLDLAATSDLNPLLTHVDAVIHSAGVAHQFKRFRGDVLAFQDVNVAAAERIARASAEAGVKQFILLSSVKVYRSSEDGVCDEHTPCEPVGPYAQSKYEGEQRVLDVARETGMPTTVFRLSPVYGEEDRGNVARLMRAIDRGRFVWVGSGQNRKSLIHRDDVARACATVLENSPSSTDIYNLSSYACEMREVVEGLADALGKRVPRLRIPAEPVLRMTGAAAWLARGRGRIGSLHSTVHKWLADDVYESKKFQRAFRFQPQVELRDGLSREVEWYRNLRAA